VVSSANQVGKKFLPSFRRYLIRASNTWMSIFQPPTTDRKRKSMETTFKTPKRDGFQTLLRIPKSGNEAVLFHLSPDSSRGTVLDSPDDGSSFLPNQACEEVVMEDIAPELVQNFVFKPTGALAGHRYIIDVTERAGDDLLSEGLFLAHNDNGVEPDLALYLNSAGTWILLVPFDNYDLWISEAMSSHFLKHGSFSHFGGVKLPTGRASSKNEQASAAVFLANKLGGMNVGLSKMAARLRRNM
jgi:hypothetical protein